MFGVETLQILDETGSITTQKTSLLLTLNAKRNKKLIKYSYLPFEIFSKTSFERKDTQKPYIDVAIRNGLTTIQLHHSGPTHAHVCSELLYINVCTCTYTYLCATKLSTHWLFHVFIDTKLSDGRSLTYLRQLFLVLIIIYSSQDLLIE